MPCTRPRPQPTEPVFGVLVIMGNASLAILEFIGAMQRKLGKVTQTSNTGFNVRTFNFTTTVVVNQNTAFEQGTGTDVFAFEMNSGNGSGCRSSALHLIVPVQCPIALANRFH